VIDERRWKVGQVCAIKAYGGVEVEINAFLASAISYGKWATTHSDSFTCKDRVPGTYPENRRLSGGK